MPFAKPRFLEDSRSETSSTITNLKERTNLIASSASGVPKGKRIASGAPNGSTILTKTHLNGTTVTPADVDPNLPRTDWLSFPPSTLHHYRHAYRLATPSAYTHPHADLIYKSSRTAQRAPSQVLTRRRLRGLKQARRKGSTAAAALKVKEKIQGKDGPVTREESADHLSRKNSTAATTTTPEPRPTSTTTKGPPASLAMSVRRHFNAQTTTESEVLAKFLYVVHASHATHPESYAHLASNPACQSTIKLPGHEGDGRGRAMGSRGREMARNDGAEGGGELGFRLRFRPEGSR